MHNHHLFLFLGLDIQTYTMHAGVGTKGVNLIPVLQCGTVVSVIGEAMNVSSI